MCYKISVLHLSAVLRWLHCAFNICGQFHLGHVLILWTLNVSTRCDLYEEKPNICVYLFATFLLRQKISNHWFLIWPLNNIVFHSFTFLQWRYHVFAHEINITNIITDCNYSSSMCLCNGLFMLWWFNRWCYWIWILSQNICASYLIWSSFFKYLLMQFRRM